MRLSFAFLAFSCVVSVVSTVITELNEKSFNAHKEDSDNFFVVMFYNSGCTHTPVTHVSFCMVFVRDRPGRAGANCEFFAPVCRHRLVGRLSVKRCACYPGRSSRRSVQCMMRKMTSYSARSTCKTIEEFCPVRSLGTQNKSTGRW